MIAVGYNFHPTQQVTLKVHYANSITMCTLIQPSIILNSITQLNFIRQRRKVKGKNLYTFYVIILGVIYVTCRMSRQYGFNEKQCNYTLPANLFICFDHAYINHKDEYRLFIPKLLHEKLSLSRMRVGIIESHHFK